ncbi:recombinase family protein [Mesobacterium sp. TK19101]|uniref:Recombinase family protein n=1 Tax=Mesobacterium hydrothermale TaxID=3111907 RepID=A0ABU6HHD0_9RHOB|nr:recombinase family protein [Mesobacterium sp. TK19101]MEC3861874.1 recombinase family protein [Mesobacterium sp. TK19101]
MPARTLTPKLSVLPPSTRAVIYARVSSKEQEKEGYSIPAQLKLLKDYAAAEGFTVAKEYVDVETAKQTGRGAFGEMVNWLRAHPDMRVVLVEKTDRLYRNLKDWVTIDELDAEIHFPKEGVVLSRDSRSSEKFMHGIKVLMAKNYIDNLSEEARKGMQEKAEQGIWPTKTPLGYLNVTGPDGRKVIAVDQEVAPMITKLFEWYATGEYALKEVAKKARAAGLVYKKSGAPVPTSTVHSILRNRLYTGWFEWNGKLYQGKHDALVPVELWERVQGVMDGRNASKHRRMTHDFAFSGLIACARCGCSVVGEIKKQKYIYYHCTGYADRCRASLPRAVGSMCARRCWSSSSPPCLAGFASMTRCWSGCARPCTPATPTSAASIRRRLRGSKPSTPASASGSARCMSTSSTGRSPASFSRRCRASGAKSSAACNGTSSATRKPSSPTWKKVCGFSNWLGTRRPCSSSSRPARSGGF